MSRLNVRFIIKMLGMMFILETLFMLLATGVAFIYKGDDFYPFLWSTGILFVAGGISYFIGFRAEEHAAGRREGMLTVALTWLLLSLFGMLPFYLGGYVNSITDAYFETMSGFTTTGASIFRDIEVLPKGILFWRTLTQWQGGMGMIVFTVALMPIFGGGASQMFNAEVPGITHERFRPRVTQVAKRLWGIYVLLTGIVSLLLWIGPMDIFDAVCHAFTTMSTGGSSTKNASVGYWNSSYVEYIIAVFMCVGATNITLIYFSFSGNFKKLFEDEETRWFYSFIAVAIFMLAGWLWYNGLGTGVEEVFRKSVFQVASLMSSSGFGTEDFTGWGPFFWLMALIMMTICGCAGSTSGGLKMGRVVILIKNLLNEFKKQTHPHAVLPVRMNGRVVAPEVIHRVLAFTFVYFVLIVISCMVLMLDGLGFIESIGAAISCISNVGPGFGDIAAAGNYAALPDFSKWFLSLLMLTGRLEIFTILTILLPSFWKQ